MPRRCAPPMCTKQMLTCMLSSLIQLAKLLQTVPIDRLPFSHSKYFCCSKTSLPPWLAPLPKSSAGLLLHARCNYFSVKFRRRVQVVVVRRQPRRAQPTRLFFRQHSQRAANFQSFRRNPTHHRQHIFKFVFRRFSPRRAPNKIASRLPTLRVSPTQLQNSDPLAFRVPICRIMRALRDSTHNLPDIRPS